MKKLFLAIAAWFTWLNWYPGFKDSDGFYHAKLVELMRDHGIAHHFPWLPLTVLADNFADHHFAYHLLIVPFSFLTSGLVASKIVSIALGVAALLVIYRLLSRLNVPRPGVFVALLAIAPYFVLRATMVKASGAALCVQFLLLGAILFKKPRAAFALSALYVYIHGGFPFALIMLGCALLAEIFTRSAEGQGSIAEMKTNIIATYKEYRPLIVAIPLGLLAGLIINPYFPNNLYFYWYQIIQVAVVGTPRTLMVGAEWYPVNIQEFFAVSFPLIMALCVPIALLVWLKRVPQYTRESATRLIMLFLLTSITFLLTLRSNRHAEYFLPYLALLAGYVWHLAAPRLDREQIRAKVTQIRTHRPYLAASFYGVASLFLLAPIGSIVFTVIMLRAHVLPWNAAQKTAECVQVNTKPGELVFDGSWDYFPELWYWNSQNKYINGLDTRFLYAKNPDMALAYQELEQAPQSTRKLSVEQILAKFPVNVIVMPKSALRLTAIQNMRNVPNKFAVLCEDSAAVVFRKQPDK